MSDALYFDHQSTTPLDPRIAMAMQRYSDSRHAGNPHADHVAGRANWTAVQTARGQIATLVGATSEEIIFTSGATESNNIAIQGIARALMVIGPHRVVQVDC